MAPPLPKNSTETLRALLQAIQDGNRQLAQTHAGVLHDWFRHYRNMPSQEDLQQVCREFIAVQLRWIDRPRR